MSFSPPHSDQMISHNPSGHEELEKFFYSAWQKKKLPHALLLTGVQGAGKYAFALRCASFLLAPIPDAPSDFGEGEVQNDTTDEQRKNFPVSHGLDPEFVRKIAAAQHPDIKILSPDTEQASQQIPVEAIRGLISFMHLTPATGKWRIAIIDQAEKMNKNAANALLKILEEPNGHSIIFLTTQLPGNILPTLRSRCSLLKFQPLPEEKIAKKLQEIYPDITAQDVSILARFSQGGFGKAQSLYEDKTLSLYRELWHALEGFIQGKEDKFYEFAQQSFKKDAAQHNFAQSLFLLQCWMQDFARAIFAGTAMPTYFGGEENLRQVIIRNNVITPFFIQNWLMQMEVIEQAAWQSKSFYLSEGQAWHVVTQALRKALRGIPSGNR